MKVKSEEQKVQEFEVQKVTIPIEGSVSSKVQLWELPRYGLV